VRRELIGVGQDDDQELHGGQVLGRVLAQLEDLKSSPTGTVIFEQLDELLGDHRDIVARIDQTYALLLHLLLESYATDPRAEHVMKIHAGMIRSREAPPAAEQPTAQPATEPAAPTMTPADAHPVWGRPAPPPGAATPTVPATEPEEPSTEGATAALAASAGERRVHSAYRLHLDRKRDEIEKLQETLAKSVTEAVQQNREFGALLQIELRALQQAEGAAEVEQLRQILIGGIGELIQGQRQLGQKLHRTGDYLKLIKSDSQRLRDELNKVRLLSLTDEFTGLPNRRAFMRRLQDEISRAQRYGIPLAMALLDLDEFKAINDAFGHAGGDEVLRCYATQVLTVLRHHDLVARYGGEEFAVLLPNTAQEGAVAAMAKVRERAQATNCVADGRKVPMPTFSAGVTLYVPGEAPNVLIERADRALYRAKRSGRDRVEIELGAPPGDSEDDQTSGF
jgi:diguanylate cyclase